MMWLVVVVLVLQEAKSWREYRKKNAVNLSLSTYLFFDIVLYYFREIEKE